MPLKLSGRAGAASRRSHLWQKYGGHVALAGLLGKVNNVVPCYAMIKEQLGDVITEEPRRIYQGEHANPTWGHKIAWANEDQEHVFEAEGPSKAAAKNSAAKQFLLRLSEDKHELMDPTGNVNLAEWAIQSLNTMLDASMEVTEEELDDEYGEDEENVEESSSSMEWMGNAQVTCTWSCSQLPGDITVTASAGTVAHSRRQVMADLYKELPSDLDAVISSLSADSPKASTDKPKHLGQINTMHTNTIQKLGIDAQHDYSGKDKAEVQCRLRWSFYDEAQGAQRTEEVTATGATKDIAKGRANQKMLVARGHIPDFADDFFREVALVKNLLDEGQHADAVSRACTLVQQNSPWSWAFFLPDVLRGILAENNMAGLSDVLSVVRSNLGEDGMP
jgi:hypothetical protein